MKTVTVSSGAAGHIPAISLEKIGKERYRLFVFRNGSIPLSLRQECRAFHVVGDVLLPSQDDVDR